MPQSWLIPGIAVLVFLTLVIVQVVMHSQKPIRSALLSLLPGPAALVCVNLGAAWTGVSIPLSVFNVAVSSVLGIPGVTCLLLLPYILGG